jgi:hypothetical protein
MVGDAPMVAIKNMMRIAVLDINASAANGIRRDEDGGIRLRVCGKRRTNCMRVTIIITTQ